MNTPTNRPWPLAVILALLSGLMVFGASAAIAKKPHPKPQGHKHHAKRHPSKRPTRAFPPGPTVATFQAIECATHSCSSTNQITNMRILKAGAPRRGTGVTGRAGGDGVPRNVVIYPVLISYDQVETQTVYHGGGYTPITTSTTTRTTHNRERHDTLLEPDGSFRGNIKAATSTCDPPAPGCGTSFGGGA